MPKAPYVIFGFDVDPADPNGAAIIQRVQAALPPMPGLGSVGVENVFFVEAAPSQAYKCYEDIARVLWAEDKANGGALRWFVQLCGTADFAGG